MFAAVAAYRDANGRPLPLADAASIGYFTLIAGQETTSHLVATVLRHAIGTDMQWRRIVETPNLASHVVDDVLRHEPPVTTWRRITSRPVTLGGVPLPDRAELLLMFGNPRTSAVSRPRVAARDAPRQHAHLAFGVGRHRCLGAELARLEATVVVQAAARRLPDLRIVPEDCCDGDDQPAMLSFQAPRSLPVQRQEQHEAAPARKLLNCRRSMRP